MKIVKPGHEILTTISKDGMDELRHLERVARVCYQSEPKTDSPEDTKNFIRRLICSDHTAMLEHGGMSVLFTCDRGVSHELVRHRMASFAQESTRWCNYSKDKYDNELSFVIPYFVDEEDEKSPHGRYWWESAMEQAEESYLNMIENGYSAQEARDVLPNSLKTQIVVTANWREWRHIFELRCARDAHPQMKELMIFLLCDVRSRIPVLFEDIQADWDWLKAYIKADGLEVMRNVVMAYFDDGSKKWSVPV